MNLIFAIRTAWLVHRSITCFVRVIHRVIIFYFRCFVISNRCPNHPREHYFRTFQKDQLRRRREKIVVLQSFWPPKAARKFLEENLWLEKNYDLLGIYDLLGKWFGESVRPTTNWKACALIYKKIKLESGAAIAGTIKTEPSESEVVVKTEVEDVAQPRLAAKMMLGVLGIKT